MRDFFYITTRDNQIFEIEKLGTRLEDSLELWKNGGLIMFPSLGININAVDVSKILNKEQYMNYLDSVQPKVFIANGTWYDNKDKSKPLRYEKWRELEIEQKRSLMIEEPQEEKMNAEQIVAWMKKNKPEFLKEMEKVTKKFTAVIPPKQYD